MIITIYINYSLLLTRITSNLLLIIWDKHNCRNDMKTSVLENW